MKNLKISHLLLITLVVLLMSFTKSDETKNSLIGTWQICGSDSQVEKNLGGKEGNTRYKIIGETTFVVADVSLSDNTFTGDFLGTYTIDKNIYTEHIKLTYPGYKNYKDQVYTFQFELKNDLLIVIGTNNKFNETWKRIKL